MHKILSPERRKMQRAGEHKFNSAALASPSKTRWKAEGGRNLKCEKFLHKMKYAV